LAKLWRSIERHPRPEQVVWMMMAICVLKLLFGHPEILIQRFNQTDLEDLPVVDSNPRFVGILDRGKLHSNLLASLFGAAS
jgi:Mg/Co/Ni transporter MgtE